MAGVESRLAELPYPAYLCAMHVILTELRRAHRVFMSDLAQFLTGVALNRLMFAIEEGGNRLESNDQEMLQGLADLIDDDKDPVEEGPAVYLAVLHILESLIRDLYGRATPYAAVDYVTILQVRSRRHSVVGVSGADQPS